MRGVKQSNKSFFILLILMLFSGATYIYLISYQQNHSFIEMDQQY